MKPFPPIFSAAIAGLLIVVAPVASPTAYAQDAAASASPKSAPEAATQQVRAFYQWYMHAINKSQFPLEGKYRAEAKRYVTARLLKEIDRKMKEEGGLEADYFIAAQDWDKEWEQHIELKNVQASGAKGSAEVILSGPSMKQRLRLQLALEDKLWKVDKVAGME